MTLKSWIIASLVGIVTSVGTRFILNRFGFEGFPAFILNLPTGFLVLMAFLTVANIERRRP